MKKTHGVFCVAVLLIAAMVAFTGCDSSDDGLTGGASGKAKYAIGDTGPGGGRIFYVSGPAGFSSNGVTCHYLEAAPADMSTTLTWSSSSYNHVNISGATEVGIGRGYAFTEAILAVDTAAPAALVCRNATYGGKTDWYLPNEHELRIMYANIAAIGGFTNDYYWSSTQGNPNYSSAWVQNLVNGDQTNHGKANTYRVRAIRAF
ncbi:hypothetical protein AGMMS49579_02870 [Spirochaetia bacterium]|nr:hypothetical protein AGMMS49579_02870 [Spirochaetia bacterium]